MRIKLFIFVLAGCFFAFSLNSEAQKSNILVEKGLAYLASTQSTTKGYDPGQGQSTNPEFLPEMSKAVGDWGGGGLTSLCLQAFLQFGHNIDDPLYGTQVTNAINYLLNLQAGDGSIGTWSTGYETAMAIEALNLALETPLFAGGLISGTLKTDIENAVAAAVSYYTFNINVAWNAVSWRYNSGYTGEYSGDMSVNQWVYLALDAVDYEDKDVWNKIYTYLNTVKCASGSGSRVGYQSCGTRPQGMTCAGSWGAVLAGDHGVAAATALKGEFYDYLEDFSLAQLVDLGSIGSNQIYSGGGYYYYLYGFAKAMSLGNKTIFSGGNWYDYMYLAIEAQHYTDGNGNYYWDRWGGQGANMETALALLCLLTQELPVGSVLTVSLNTGVLKNDCFEFTIYDENGNAAGENGGVWYTNIPNSEWTSTSGDYFELTINLEESGNFSAEIKNTCVEAQTAELCYRTFLQEQMTDEKCFVIEDVPYLQTIGATGFVNAIGGLNVIIVVPPTPIPVMILAPPVIGYNPFEYSTTYDFTFDILEAGGETALTDIDIFASDLVDQFGNIIPDANFTFTPNHIDIIPAGTSMEVLGSLITPDDFTKADIGLFIGNITAQTGDQTKGINFEIGQPDMIIDPDAASVPYTNGSTTFDIDFTGLIGADWDIAFAEPWITVDPATGSGDFTVTVNYEANPDDVERIATLTISAPDALNPEEFFVLTQDPAPFPFFTNIDLEVTMDMVTWWDAMGSIGTGFEVGLATTVPEYFMNLGSETATNTPLVPDMYPFFLDPFTVPEGFYDYWATRGVVEGATGWQGIMWEIINGAEPTFFINVEDVDAQSFSLVDGLHYLLNGSVEFLQVPGMYPLGDYGYWGFVEGQNGQMSEQIDVMINFYDATPRLLTADLIYSYDIMNWATAWGSLENGYLVRLDEIIEYYYLDLDDNTTTNVPIVNGMYPFYLDPTSVPEGFFEFWAAKGVVEGATGWQGIMWEIINGNEPTFYIKKTDADIGEFFLIDGFQYLFGQVEDWLRVNGIYPFGTYLYTGYLEGEMGVMSEEIPVSITFASDIDQQINLPVGWLGISGYIIPEDPNIVNVLSGVEDLMQIIINFGGFYWPSQNINLIGDWNTYEGYKIKMNEPGILELFGFPADPFVTLPAGLHYLPVLTPDPVPADDVLGPLGDALLFAFNIQEGLVYWPGGGLSTLETMEPGIGYLIRLMEEATIDYSAKSIANPSQVVPYINSTPWNDVTNTGNAHIIAIKTSSFENLQTGDVVGAFNASGTCVGMTEYTTNKESLALIAYGDDFTTATAEGMSDGEMISLRLYRSATGQVAELEATYDPSLNTGIFESAGLSIITQLKLGVLGINANNTPVFNIYPNPSDGVFNILSSQNASIGILNAQGQNVYNATVEGNTSIDLSHLGKGVYYLQIVTDNSTNVKKIVIE
nr:T9SS type A sorting domain-containing protein [Bacteroidota bacterium]